MVNEDVKNMAQSLRYLTTDADRGAFWADQRARIDALTPEQRQADIAAIRQRVAEIANALRKENKDQAS
jgi:hypothetical protein